MRVKIYWEGAIVSFKRDVHRHPHFIVRAGMRGVVTHNDGEEVHVKLFDHLEGAEEWNNECRWYEGMDDLTQLEDDLQIEWE